MAVRQEQDHGALTWEPNVHERRRMINKLWKDLRRFLAHMDRWCHIQEAREYVDGVCRKQGSTRGEAMQKGGAEGSKQLLQRSFEADVSFHCFRLHYTTIYTHWLDSNKGRVMLTPLKPQASAVPKIIDYLKISHIWKIPAGFLRWLLRACRN